MYKDSSHFLNNIASRGKIKNAILTIDLNRESSTVNKIAKHMAYLFLLTGKALIINSSIQY